MNLDRLLVDKLENRILVGITSFVAIMVIIGWIAINEPARMADFQEQYTGRSIERGAYLYNQNCSTCHANNGLGLSGRAPGLNNPHLFGFDYLAAERREIENLERSVLPQRALLNEYDELTASLAELEGDELATAEARIAELEPELEQAEADIAAVEEEVAAVEADMENLKGQMAQAIENGYDPDATRLQQVGWEGSLRSYVYTTLVHGRPGSNNLWPASGGGMAAWGQVAGGPLRDDELGYLTDFILNWDKGADWTIDDVNNVAAFGKTQADAATVSMASAGGDEGPMGTTDVDAILAELENYTGDPVNGQTVYNGAYGCAGCHGVEVVAPLTELTWISAVNGDGGRTHAGDPQRYIVESVVNPGAFVVEGYANGVMPANFAEQIPYQHMADILAYLESYN
jgi:mono/diheme cytochrome c family protein